VERFFGTLKEKLDRLAVDSCEALNGALSEFRFFHNHVRAHQNLDGRTPAEAWAGIDPFADGCKKEFWFDAWDGLLRGYYLDQSGNAKDESVQEGKPAVRETLVPRVPMK